MYWEEVNKELDNIALGQKASLVIFFKCLDNTDTRGSTTTTSTIMSSREQEKLENLKRRCDSLEDLRKENTYIKDNQKFCSLWKNYIW